MTATRDQLLDALQTGDEDTVRRLGWSEVIEALHSWWWSKAAFSLTDFVPYARALGDYSPADVLAALPAVAGKWRPGPGQILGAVRAQHGDGKRIDAGRATDRSRSVAALAAVRAALAAGEQPCQCGCPTNRAWITDDLEHRTDARGSFCLPVGAWRCPTCGGLEPGQVFAAEDQSNDLAEVNAA